MYLPPFGAGFYKGKIMANNKPIGVAYADPALDSWEVGTASNPSLQSSSGNITQLYAMLPTLQVIYAVIIPVLILQVQAAVKL